MIDTESCEKMSTYKGGLTMTKKKSLMLTAILVLVLIVTSVYTIEIRKNRVDAEENRIDSNIEVKTQQDVVDDTVEVKAQQDVVDDTESKQEHALNEGESDTEEPTHAESTESENAEQETDRETVVNNSDSKKEQVIKTAEKQNKDNQLQQAISNNSKSKTKKVQTTDGKWETVYEFTVNAYTKDGKPYTKTYTSKNPDETFKFYEEVVEGNKINMYEVTMTVTGKEVSRRFVEESKRANATTPETSKTTYRSTIEAYTRDGKPFTKTFESSNPDEVITYYEIEIKNEEGIFYEIKETVAGKHISKKPIKVEHTYKETLLDKEVEKYDIVEQLDETMQEGKRVVAQEGVDGITHHIKTEKLLFDTVVDVKYSAKEVRKKQDKIIKVGTLRPIGNSGKVFNSAEEATAWARKQSNDENSKWYEHGFSLFPIDHTRERISVSFTKPIIAKPGEPIGVGGGD